MADSKTHISFFYDPFRNRDIKTMPFKLQESYYFMRDSDFNFTQYSKYRVVGIKNAQGFSDDRREDSSIVVFENDKGDKSEWFGNMACMYFAITEEDIVGHLEKMKNQVTHTISQSRDEIKKLFDKSNSLLKKISASYIELREIENKLKKYE